MRVVTSLSHSLGAHARTGARLYAAQSVLRATASVAFKLALLDASILPSVTSTKDVWHATFALAKVAIFSTSDSPRFGKWRKLFVNDAALGRLFRTSRQFASAIPIDDVRRRLAAITYTDVGIGMDDGASPLGHGDITLTCDRRPADKHHVSAELERLLRLPMKETDDEVSDANLKQFAQLCHLGAALQHAAVDAVRSLALRAVCNACALSWTAIDDGGGAHSLLDDVV